MLKLTHFKNNAYLYVDAAEIVCIAGHWTQPQSPVNITPVCTEIYLKSWGPTAIPVKESRDEILRLKEEALKVVLH